MFLDSEPLGRGLGAVPSAPGIPGSGDDQRRLCVFAGTADSGGDDAAARDRSLAYIASITAAVDLPVSADFMSGYGQEPEDVAQSVARCVATGVAGLSIEDATGDPALLCTSCQSRSSASVPRDGRLINQAQTCC
jgi:hypothetical protein